MECCWRECREAEVEDMVQEIFLHAFKKLHTLRDANAFGPWIAMIARNRAMDFHRRSRETVSVDDWTNELRSSDSGSSKAEEILAIIRTLPDAYRETLVLRLVEGMTGPEIATRTGLTAASVRVNLHRGMKLLRAKLGFEEGFMNDDYLWDKPGEPDPEIQQLEDDSRRAALPAATARDSRRREGRSRAKFLSRFWSAFGDCCDHSNVGSRTRRLVRSATVQKLNEARSRAWTRNLRAVNPDTTAADANCKRQTRHCGFEARRLNRSAQTSSSDTRTR